MLSCLKQNAEALALSGSVNPKVRDDHLWNGILDFFLLH